MVTKRQARRRLWMLLGSGAVLALAVAVGLSGPGRDPIDDGPDSLWGPAVAAGDGGEPVVARERSAAATANAAARSLLAEAPVAVVVGAGNRGEITTAIGTADELRAPLLVVPGAGAAVRGADDPYHFEATVGDLGTQVLVGVGRPRLPGGIEDTVKVFDHEAAAVQTLADAAAGADTPTGAVVLVRPGDAAATLAGPAIAAAGHRVVSLTAVDPRADRDAAARLRRLDRPVVGVVGSADAWPDVDARELRWQAGVARRGLEIPGGGQILYPFRILVALYGTPESARLGVLGDQDLAGSIARAKRLAADYQPFSDVPVLPAFELIATVATGGPGDTGDYSRRVPPELVRRWVEAAGEAGVYVVLDLQPGRSDFLDQAKELRDLLSLPHVGLALDSEWRLGPDEEPLEQVGSVSIEEVNSVVEWLAALTRNERLPQKLLLLHQFDLDMIPDRPRLDTTRSEMTVAIQMDGHGTQEGKLETWNQLRTVAPPEGVWWGWKNFYDEDPVVRSPQDTLGLTPVPLFVSYQ